jgi:flagella basal body P-ring formation protein FlgA
MLFAALLFGGVTVTLAPEAKVRGTEIELGAIASVSGDELDAARLRTMRLGYAPAPGFSRLIVQARLRQDLARQFPGLELTVIGADTCRVMPSTSRVLGSAIEAAAQKEVLRLLEGREVEMQLLNKSPDLEVPAGDSAVELRVVLAEGMSKSGPVNVPVRVMVDGGLYRTVWTNWQLALWEEASVPKIEIHTGDVITLEMLERRRVASPGSGPEAALPAALVIGATASRDLPIGRPIREMDVQRPMLVKRGDMLMLEIRSGKVNARVAVTAEQDARAGERIKVTVMSNKRALTARVSSKDLAVIEIGGN